MLSETITSCSPSSDKVICRCLCVRESTVAEAIDLYGAQTWRDVRRLTGAGDGCNSCHCAIKDLLLRKRAEASCMVPQ